jgi:hypothetical protein
LENCAGVVHDQLWQKMPVEEMEEFMKLLFSLKRSKDNQDDPQSGADKKPWTPELAPYDARKCDHCGADHQRLLS